MNSSGLALSSSPSGLFADLYEFTMAQAFFQQGMTGQATFSLFVRHLPPNRGFLVNAGLQDALDFLESLAFQSADLDFLRSTGIFDGGFLEYLKGFRFTGRVRALPEGRVFFANEPVLEVTAPIIEAQIAETYIINQLNFQTLLATKAARCVHAAQGRVLADFAARRTHGSDAGLKMARCGYIAGFQSTSNVQAAQRYAIPPSGTMAHSFISSFESEEEAFRQYANSFPDRAVLLLDTYDTIQGARHAVTVGRELDSRGHRLTAVRLDSGDFLDLSRRVRRILDDAGLGYVKIIASGGLDEYAIEELCAATAPIDIFGVGTKVGVSADAPLDRYGLQTSWVRRTPRYETQRRQGLPSRPKTGFPVRDFGREIFPRRHRLRNRGAARRPTLAGTGYGRRCPSVPQPRRWTRRGSGWAATSRLWTFPTRQLKTLPPSRLPSAKTCKTLPKGYNRKSAIFDHRVPPAGRVSWRRSRRCRSRR